MDVLRTFRERKLYGMYTFVKKSTLCVLPFAFPRTIEVSRTSTIIITTVAGAAIVSHGKGG